MTEFTTLSPEGADAFAALRAAYRDRLAEARAFHAGGGQVVGVVGSTVPAEFVLAHGAFPLVLAPEVELPTPDADRFIASESWRARTVVQRAMEGSYGFLSLLILTRGSEWTYYALKEIVRQGEGANIPLLYMHDLVTTRTEAAEDYNRGRYAALREALARALKPAPEGALAKAVKVVDERLILADDLQGLRDHGQISGVEALEAIGGGLLMHPEAANRLTRTLLDAARKRPAIEGRPRVLIAPGEQIEHTVLHEVIEGAGALVVAEDSLWGSRSAGAVAAPSNDLERAIEDRSLANISGITLNPRPEREAWLRARMARGDLDAVVFYIQPGDLVFGWDYPKLKAYAEGLGLRILLLRESVETDAGRAALREQVAGFFSPAVEGALQ